MENLTYGMELVYLVQILVSSAVKGPVIILDVACVAKNSKSRINYLFNKGLLVTFGAANPDKLVKMSVS